MVRYEGEKMSKSLGNLIWARDLLEEHSADAVRILVTSHPYHETWEYDAAELAPADDLADRLLRAAKAPSGQGEPIDASEAILAFEHAMDDNLDSRRALTALGRLADAILQGSAKGRSISTARQALTKLSTVFGLTLGGNIEQRVIDGWTAHYQRFI